MVGKLVVTAGLLGASGVLLGALGAHGLKEVFDAEPKKAAAFATAVDYHLLHALALLALGLSGGSGNEVFARRSAMAAWAMVAGGCLFCGSIYAWTIGGPKWFVHVTPFGGITLVVAWAFVVWAGVGLTRSGESGKLAS